MFDTKAGRIVETTTEVPQGNPGLSISIALAIAILGGVCLLFFRA
jgi:hypothetical protein